MFTDIFEHNANVTAIGPYLSCQYNKHIQSFLIALDRRSVDLLEKTWRCPYKNETRDKWIMDTEVVSKQVIFGPSVRLSINFRKIDITYFYITSILCQYCSSTPQIPIIINKKMIYR